MINAALIQAKVNRGEGIAAAKLGEACDWRRPASASAGPAPATTRGTLTAWFNPDFRFSARTPNLYGKPLWGALCDRTGLAVGDYLFAPSGTYFVAALQPLLATAVVQCTATISIARPHGNSGPGVQPYGGRTLTTDEPLMAGWPASLLIGGRAIAGRADLPADVPLAGVQALFPAFPGVVIRTSDRVTDDQGRAFAVSASERSDLGWRCELILSVT